MPETMTFNRLNPMHGLLSNKLAHSFFVSGKIAAEFYPLKLNLAISLDLLDDRGTLITNKVELTDHISIKDTELELELELEFNQQLNYQGNNLKILLFLALFLLNSKSYRKLFSLDSLSTRTTTMSAMKLTAFISEYSFFLGRHAAELSQDNQEVRQIREIARTTSRSCGGRFFSIISQTFFRQTCNEIRREFEVALRKTKKVTLSHLQHERDLPHSIESPGILPKEEVKRGFNGWQ